MVILAAARQLIRLWRKFPPTLSGCLRQSGEFKFKLAARRKAGIAAARQLKLKVEV